jgi:hypothetical protein
LPSKKLLKCRAELYVRPASLSEYKIHPYVKNINLIANSVACLWGPACMGEGPDNPKISTTVNPDRILPKVGLGALVVTPYQRVI